MYYELSYARFNISQDNYIVSSHLVPLQLGRDVATLNAFYRMFHGESSKELHAVIVTILQITVIYREL